MHSCGNTSLSYRFSSDFLVSTKCKAIFAAASFHNSSAQFFKNLCGILTLVGSAIVLSTYNSTSHSFLWTILRACLTLLFFHRSYCSGRWLLLNYDLFVESLEKMDIRQFIKRKSFSDSRSVENISAKNWEWRFTQHRLTGLKG